ncbi:hypothetical protein MCOR27_010138 [Pyricularia oryzae]|uniref:3CxxC-type domain-containing protein n=2 Tax=Pyricularia TaxID=48558 RepID=A0ABQ8NE61_PYRGI|nr:hypothetical protein MCOR01_010163 [Pyricularia oryzae]KAI6294722.1 hypothetical protein MCOR33_008226 [Pyricularia grisea]KAH9436500.1 hypothetical protein MCOR02_000174 [Pyricularia oryzae]KAI6256405.1 hypothetical protein MCOR19_007124 [Pyricularia oryzae]KAI6268462.1 hypothetical protein MCOR27_010138 [Pyricularia oryzae]
MRHKTQTIKVATSPATSMSFPSLHPQVVEAVGDTCPIWTSKQHGRDVMEYCTHVSGHFRCGNQRCRHVWSSGLVAIRIRAFNRERYNATVFSQRCKACNRLGFLSLDEDSYVERVAYRLKKWAGVSVEVPRHEMKSTPPHMSSLCEGCRQGCCKEGGRDDLTRGLQRLSLR